MRAACSIALKPSLKCSLKRAAFCWVLVCATLSIPPGQARPVQDDFQAWQIGAVRGNITRRILFYFDTQNNEVNLTNKQGHSNGRTHEGQLLVRPALGFQVNRVLSLWQGYGFTPTFQPKYRIENQIWEQVLLEKQFRRFRVTNRTRLEIRDVANATGRALRLRNQFRVAIPFGQSPWSLVVYDEPFFNLNNTDTAGIRKGFNQNWAFIGINRRFNAHCSAEIGYLNNYVRFFQPLPDRMNHVIMLSLSLNVGNKGIDLRNSRPLQSEPPGPAFHSTLVAPVRLAPQRLPDDPATSVVAPDIAPPETTPPPSADASLQPVTL